MCNRRIAVKLTSSTALRNLPGRSEKNLLVVTRTPHLLSAPRFTRLLRKIFRSTGNQLGAGIDHAPCLRARGATTWPARFRGGAATVASRGAASPYPTLLCRHAIVRSVPRDRVRPTRPTPQSTGSVSRQFCIFASEPSAQPSSTTGFYCSRDPEFGSISAGGAALPGEDGRR